MEKEASEAIIKVYAALSLLLSLMMFLVAFSMLFLGSVGGTIFLDVAENLPFVGDVSAISIVFLVVFLFIAVFSFFVGLGLWRKREWARVAVIILSVIALFEFPIGTLIGVFGVWFFWFEPDTKKLFKKKVKN